MRAAVPPSSDAPLPPFCYDMTRLSRRVGQGAPTGIDRVDQTYFAWLLDSGAPLTGLVRTGVGYLLLDRQGMQAMRDRLLATPLTEDDTAQHGGPRKHALRQLRRHAIARAPRWGVARMLRKQLPQGVRYLNIGHSNLEEAVIGAIRKVPDGRAIAMIHDTIPLDQSETVTEKSRARFHRALTAALGCDLLLANSGQTRADILRFGGDRTPSTHVLFLGMEPRLVRATDPPPSDAPPTFVMLGTIEPRKNHALILDIWARFHATRASADIPHLVIIGGRGWRNEGVFETLDTAPFMGQCVHEVGRLDDASMSTTLSHANALLFPSIAEGYGLPPMEAASIGLPVISADLAPVREILGDYPVYADTNDMQQWINAIDNVVAAGRTSAWKQPPPLPTWESHFRQLRSLL